VQGYSSEHNDGLLNITAVRKVIQQLAWSTSAAHVALLAMVRYILLVHPTPRKTGRRPSIDRGTLLPKTVLFRTKPWPLLLKPRLHRSTPPDVRPERPRSDLPTRHRPVGATLSSDLQTEEPPVDRLQGREEEGADFPPPHILFLPLYTREEKGAQISRTPCGTLQ
jgi:hypothetical protein